MLPSKEQLQKLIDNAGGYTALRNGFHSIGGTDMKSDPYYSSTEVGHDNEVYAYEFQYYSSGWIERDKDFYFYVRPVLAFGGPSITITQTEDVTMNSTKEGILRDFKARVFHGQ